MVKDDLICWHPVDGAMRPRIAPPSHPVHIAAPETQLNARTELLRSRLARIRTGPVHPLEQHPWSRAPAIERASSDGTLWAYRNRRDLRLREMMLILRISTMYQPVATK